MQVILMQDILHTGKRGEIIDVKPGYARNFLVPKGLALEATPGNLSYFEQQRRKIEVRHQKEREEAVTAAASGAKSGCWSTNGNRFFNRLVFSYSLRKI